MKKKLKEFFNSYQSIVISVSATLALCMTVGSLILVVAAWPTEVKRDIKDINKRCEEIEQRHEKDMNSVVTTDQLKAEIEPVKVSIEYIIEIQKQILSKMP